MVIRKCAISNFLIFTRYKYLIQQLVQRGLVIAHGIRLGWLWLLGISDLVDSQIWSWHVRQEQSKQSIREITVHQRLAVGDQLVPAIVRIVTATNRALVGLQTLMPSHVVVSVSGHWKVLAADVTMERLATGMDAHMSLQVSALNESLAAWMIRHSVYPWTEVFPLLCMSERLASICWGLIFLSLAFGLAFGHGCSLILHARI